jgi:hypothetical protein
MKSQILILRSERSERLEGWPKAAHAAILRDAVIAVAMTAPQDEGRRRRES